MTPVVVPRGPRIAYVVSRFPKLSETFVLREMDALERLGWHIDLFPFIRLSEPVRHAEVGRWLTRLDASPSPLTLVWANLVWLGRAPIRLSSLYLLTMSRLWRHPKDMARGLLGVALGAFWARRARDRGITHVHAHFALHSTIAALAIGHLAKIPFSFTCHAQDVYARPAMLDEKARRACFVVVISELLRERYLAPRLPSADLAKVRLIRCGLDLADYPMQPEPPAASPLLILAVARLVPMKGLAHLIDACALLRMRDVTFQCRIIGDGPQRAVLRERIDRHGLQHCVALLGPRSQSEVRDALREAGIFVQPSIVTGDGHMEGVPVSLMEAMAIGVPVVSTRSGAIPELVESGVTGMLVEPGDPAALAAAIAHLAANGEHRRELVRAARRRIVQEYDVHKNVAQLDALLRHSTTLHALPDTHPPESELVVLAANECGPLNSRDKLPTAPGRQIARVSQKRS